MPPLTSVLYSSHLRLRWSVFDRTVEAPVTKRYSSPYFFSNIIVTIYLRPKVNKAVDRFEAFSIHFKHTVQWSAIRQCSCHVLGFLLTDLETELFAFLLQSRVIFFNSIYITSNQVQIVGIA